MSGCESSVIIIAKPLRAHLALGKLPPAAVCIVSGATTEKTISRSKTPGMQRLSINALPPSDHRIGEGG